MNEEREEKEERDGHRKRSLFAAATGCESRSRAILKYDCPLNTFGSAYCFSFTLALPSIPLLASRSPPLSFLVLCSPSSARRSFSLPPLQPSFLLMPRTLRSGIDRCHRGTNTPGRTCQRVLMSSVIVINTLIRTVAKTSDAFVAACAILNIMRVTFDIS